MPAGQWYPAQQTPPEPVEPPEGWQAGYLKQKKMARWFMISTIVLAVTTVLAGMLSLGLAWRWRPRPDPMAPDRARACTTTVAGCRASATTKV